MRVISQDGTMDMPYEMSTMWCDDDGAVLLQPIGDIGEYQTFAKYSTKEKAIKAMEMLREVYNNNEFYHHTATTNTFQESICLLSNEKFKEVTSEYFRFPHDDEIEV